MNCGKEGGREEYDQSCLLWNKSGEHSKSPIRDANSGARIPLIWEEVEIFENFYMFVRLLCCFMRSFVVGNADLFYFFCKTKSYSSVLPSHCYLSYFTLTRRSHLRKSVFHICV